MERFVETLVVAVVGFFGVCVALVPVLLMAGVLLAIPVSIIAFAVWMVRLAIG